MSHWTIKILLVLQVKKLGFGKRRFLERFDLFGVDLDFCPWNRNIKKSVSLLCESILLEYRTILGLWFKNRTEK